MLNNNTVIKNTIEAVRRSISKDRYAERNREINISLYVLPKKEKQDEDDSGAKSFNGSFQCQIGSPRVVDAQAVSEQMTILRDQSVKAIINNPETLITDHSINLDEYKPHNSYIDHENESQQSGITLRMSIGRKSLGTSVTKSILSKRFTEGLPSPNFYISRKNVQNNKSISFNEDTNCTLLSIQDQRRQRLQDINEAVEVSRQSQQLYSNRARSKYESHISNPPSIVDQMKIQNRYSNNPTILAQKPKFDYSMQNSPYVSTKNAQSKEYLTFDHRPRAKLSQHSLINGGLQDSEIILTKHSSRQMSSYKDQILHPHFSRDYQQTIETLPSVFKRCNGEFTAFASAYSQHKPVLTKQFTAAHKSQLRI